MTRSRLLASAVAAALGVLIAAALYGQSDAGEEAIPAGTRAIYSEVVLPPPGRGGLATGERDIHGEEIRVSCAVCHRPGDDRALVTNAAGLTEVHAGLTFAHGGNECASCHHPERRDRLRLANGKAVGFADSILLCGQCHGAQKRDFDHGAHGGMSGHWDLSRGPRTRNHCVHCHDPHAPAILPVMPADPPRDRFLNAQGEHR